MSHPGTADASYCRNYPNDRRKGHMNVFLWTLQAILAAIFLVSGASKSTLSKQRLVAIGQTGVGPLPMPLVRFGAACELLGAPGIILPRATGIAPVLTPSHPHRLDRRRDQPVHIMTRAKASTGLPVIGRSGPAYERHRR